VINALTDRCHPCQLLADIQTYIEHRGDIRGRTVAWIGDGNNMCNSYMGAAKQFGFKLNVATPKGYEPHPMSSPVRLAMPKSATIRKPPHVALIWWSPTWWASMGQEEETAARAKVFAAFQVDAKLMKLAARTRCSCTACPRTAVKRSRPRSSTPAERSVGRGREPVARAKGLMELLLT